MDHVTHEPLSWGSYILFLDFSSYLFSTNTKGFFFINLRMWVQQGIQNCLSIFTSIYAKTK